MYILFNPTIIKGITNLVSTPTSEVLDTIEFFVVVDID